MSYTVTSKGFTLSLNEDIPIPFDFSITDVKDFTKRKRNFSKEIDFPDTSNNRMYFAGSFGFTETENGIYFDSTQKQSCIVSANGIVTMPNGVLQLKTVTILNGEITFTCQIYSEIVDLFLELSNVNISDFDWSDLNHTLTLANIENSWLGTAGSGYYYPLIDKGLARPTPSTFRNIDLVPYVYLTDLMKRAFKVLGLTISSTWLNSTLIKNILVGYGGGELVTITTAELNNRKVLMSGEGFISQNSPVKTFQIATPMNAIMPAGYAGSNFVYTETQDIYNQHIGGSVTIARTGNYNYKIIGTIDYLINVIGGTLNNVAYPKFNVYRNGIQIYSQDFGVISTSSFTLNTNVNGNNFFYGGDVITWSFIFGNTNYTPSTNSYVNRTVTINSTAISFISTDTQISDGSDVDVSKFLPEIKASDFVGSVVKHFHLHVSDPVEGVVKIEPLLSFYSNTDVFTDITKTVDQYKPIINEPTGNNFPKKVAYKFKESKDFEFTKYLDSHGKAYGDMDFEQGSYFATGEQKLELAYSTIVPYNIPSTNLVVPRFVKQNNNGTLQPEKGAMRMMFRNGMYSGNWTLSDATGLITSAKTNYPLVHHFNSMNSPTFDLNFELPIELFYIASNVTTANAYSTYYEEFINEQVSPAGKMITLYNDWSNQQISKLDFGRLIMYKDSLFRLQTISDFDRTTALTAKTIMTKVLKAKKPNRAPLPWNPAPTVVGSFVYPAGQTWKGSVYQMGTSAPSIDSVFVNSMFVTITASRTSTGTYKLTGFNNLSNQTQVTYTNVVAWNDSVLLTILDSSTIKIETFNGGSLSDGILPEPESTGLILIVTVINL